MTPLLLVATPETVQGWLIIAVLSVFIVSVVVALVAAWDAITLELARIRDNTNRTEDRK